MDTYSIFREFADSWGLLAMMMFFIGAVLMLFRPSAKDQHKEAANIPFKKTIGAHSASGNKPVED